MLVDEVGRERHGHHDGDDGQHHGVGRQEQHDPTTVLLRRAIDGYKMTEAEEAIIARSAEWSYQYSIALGHRFLAGEPSIIRSDRVLDYLSMNQRKRDGKFFHPDEGWPEAEPFIAQNGSNSYWYAHMLGKRFEAGEAAIIRDCPSMVTNYAQYIIKGRWLEAEPFIREYQNYWSDYARAFNIKEAVTVHGRADRDDPRNVLNMMANLRELTPEEEAVVATSPKHAFNYAKYQIKKPFPAGEAAIATDQYFARTYAYEVLKRPFPLGEPAIATDPWGAAWYAHYVLGGPFKLGEPTIATNADASVYYAVNVLGDRFPAGEAVICTNAIAIADYFLVMDEPWPEAEPIITTDPHLAYDYAKDVIKGPFPAREPVMMRFPSVALKYALRVLGRRWPEIEELARDHQNWQTYKERFNVEDP